MPRTANDWVSPVRISPWAIADVAPLSMPSKTELSGVPRIGVGCGVRVAVGVDVEGGSGVKVGAARWVAATMVAMVFGDVDGTGAGAQPASKIGRASCRERV